MLKLVYHSVAFGPIDLEYDRLIIRVGRSEDNDLVLRHPSVEPHHCLLAFRGEKVLWLPPSQVISAQTDLELLAGPELSAGEAIQIGELQFSLVHSSRTMAIPQLYSQGQAAQASEGSAATETDAKAHQRRYFCPNCQEFIQDSSVKLMGLVGHAKHRLCPKCGRLLETEQKPKIAPIRRLA